MAVDDRREVYSMIKRIKARFARKALAGAYPWH
ncbi:hypothetical protein CLV70_104119 [Pseudosporangium ferrugineum]|uniref:Uncharacterized protein n=1 Tax=Pseudosporangium ferrugineum TaxID=439699 RepID=A0A2T0SAW6_9ACTN|nr:hypothetical protein CLV70_104119 [Pseudosporangium ferrugineum]